MPALQIFKKKNLPPSPKQPDSRMVMVRMEDGKQVVGQIAGKSTDGRVNLKLAVPDSSGLFLVTDSIVPVEEKNCTNISVQSKTAKVATFRKVLSFDDPQVTYRRVTQKSMTNSNGGGEASEPQMAKCQSMKAAVHSGAATTATITANAATAHDGTSAKKPGMNEAHAANKCASEAYSMAKCAGSKDDHSIVAARHDAAADFAETSMKCHETMASQMEEGVPGKMEHMAAAKCQKCAMDMHKSAAEMHRKLGDAKTATADMEKALWEKVKAAAMTAEDSSHRATVAAHGSSLMATGMSKAMMKPADTKGVTLPGKTASQMMEKCMGIECMGSESMKCSHAGDHAATAYAHKCMAKDHTDAASLHNGLVSNPQNTELMNSSYRNAQSAHAAASQEHMKALDQRTHLAARQDEGMALALDTEAGNETRAAAIPSQKATSVDGNSDTTTVVDFQDVEFEGYASTFESTTPGDRVGDYVIDGAFSKTIPKFMKNPVMLMDHNNSVKCIAGSFLKLAQDKTGLAVKGRISNSPHLIDIRFKIVEKHLRAMSIGGMFFYEDDGRGIREIDLYEISLVAIPCNPDALFNVRSISIDDAEKSLKTYVSNFGNLKLAA